ncbi:MAG: VWA domain-containing protein, partial [Terriglobales bacterium]
MSKHDVVIVVDRSRSMSFEDCRVQPDERSSESGTVSRWTWCRQQLEDLSSKAAGAFPDGMRLVLFASNATTFENVSAKSVQDIFTDNQPDGATNAAKALQSELQRHFEQKTESAGAKPLLMVVITDGCPANPTTVINGIVDATNKMTA